MCNQRERLMDYLYEEASPIDRRAVEGHLETCGACREEVRAFRRVREDLLAWEVPACESVWTPFAPAPVVPWFRQVPAWAMAAAAGLMFVVGTAGGFAAQMFATGRQVAAITATSPAPEVVSAAVAGLSDDDVRQLVRREMTRTDGPAQAGQEGRAGRAAMTRVTLPAVFDTRAGQKLIGQAEALVSASEGRQWERLQEFLYAVARENERERRAQEQTIGALRQQVQDLQSVVNHLMTQQMKGQQ